MAIELGSAYFTLLPSMAGTAAAVKTGLGATAVTGAFRQGGAAGGAAMGAGVASGLGKAVPIIGAAVAGIGIASLFTDALSASSDLNESANAVRVSFGEAAAEIENLGSTAAERLGLSQLDFNSLATRFSSFATTIAGDGRTVGSVIDELTTRGADFASVYNIEAADALALFQSGLAGESEPLRRFGLDLSAANVEQTAYRLGIAAVGEELTEQQKIQARYAAILEQTAQVEGDRARTADEYANQQRENAARWEDSLARIGEALLPAATQFANFVGDEDNVERLDRLIDLFVEAEPAISAVADALLFLADIKLAEFDGVVGVLAALADGNLTLEESLDLLSRLPEPLRAIPIAFVNLIAGVLNPVIDAANGTANAIEAVINALSGLTGTTIDFPTIGRLGTLSNVAPGGGGGGGPAFQADGGRTIKDGWSWVGERGPELLWMNRGAEVIPLDHPSLAAPVQQDFPPLEIPVVIDGREIARATYNWNRSTK